MKHLNRITNHCKPLKPLLVLCGVITRFFCKQRRDITEIYSQKEIMKIDGKKLRFHQYHASIQCGKDVQPEYEEYSKQRALEKLISQIDKDGFIDTEINKADYPMDRTITYTLWVSVNE
jgi:hypothetical protein